MPRVTVIGGANVDIKGRTVGSHVSGTSNPGQVAVSAGGVARNIAENLARLDIEASLISCVGDDDHGRFVQKVTMETGVDVSRVATAAMPTGIYLAILDGQGEMVSAVSDMRAIAQLTPAELTRHRACLEQSAMIVADCNLEAECLEWICGVARKTAAPLLIEPVSMSKSLKLGRLDVSGVNACVTPNLKQLEALTGEREIARGTAALHRMGFGKVMVLAGQAGAHVSESGGTRIDVPAFANTAIADVTGAGDAAVAGFVCGLVLGKSLPDAARIGQAAAAVKLCSLSTVAPVLSRDRVFQLAEVSEEQPPD